jgi:hypothetical protein
MEEVLIHCDGYTSDTLMKALAPYVKGGATLELRPRTVPIRSPDPNVLAGIIQAGATVATALIAGLIEWRRANARASSPDARARQGDRPIRIYGSDGITVEIPLDVDGETLALLVERVRQTEKPHIQLL